MDADHHSHYMDEEKPANPEQPIHDHLNHTYEHIHEHTHDMSAHTSRGGGMSGAGHAGHAGTHDHHAMMVKDFRRRFYGSLLLTVPILILSPAIQGFLGLDLSIPGGQYILFALSSLLFVYGGQTVSQGRAGRA